MGFMPSCLIFESEKSSFSPLSTGIPSIFPQPKKLKLCDAFPNGSPVKAPKSAITAGWCFLVCRQVCLRNHKQGELHVFILQIETFSAKSEEFEAFVYCK